MHALEVRNIMYFLYTAIILILGDFSSII
jgi:hypothetical protein